ncbi:MAG TPA: GNAT family N-acetyltransferase [Acidimicrobiales bacterium]|nr:GNAT family N-acetyltransferase [Acidimicrobiales bacterium]
MDLRTPIATARLTLRRLTLSDFDDHYRLFGDPVVARYLYTEPLDRSSAADHLARRVRDGERLDGEWLNLAVEENGRFLGEVGICQNSSAHRDFEIGFVLAPGEWGRGVATEAAAALVDAAVERLGAHRVTGHLDARNAASAAVLERLGMRLEAHFIANEWVKGEWCDELVYATLAEEWRARRRGSP